MADAKAICGAFTFVIVRKLSMNENTMTIREMCDAFDVTPRTLRFYEAKELLSPIRIGQKRLFTDRDRARLKLILRGKGFGFSLEEIRQILDLYNADDNQAAQLRRFGQVGRTRLDELLAQQAQIASAIEELKDLLRNTDQRLVELAAMKNAAE
jgi:DNA-binding transcriptional MerR regulator